jgi:23S rRNA (cytidine1920-2'-O)/16S rRNA (cytidine1409-2'-O)-methyltransferase
VIACGVTDEQVDVVTNGRDRPSTRLDLALVERGLVATRARARDLVRRGHVLIDGVVAAKPSVSVPARATVAIAGEGHHYVSRGAEKLAAALDHFCIDVTGRVGLDIGASTGGFTEVLLARGASRVYAVDVGHGQLHPRIAADARVIVLERTDARVLTASLVPDPPHLIVADVSFISLTKALGSALALASPGGQLVALIKPQFEAGPDHIGKGGIVRDPAVRERVAAGIAAWLSLQPGWRVLGLVPSPIVGGSGNHETLIGARRDG